MPTRTLTLDFCLQNWETIHFCFSRRPSALLVRAAPGNEARSRGAGAESRSASLS